jgi:hypothetical protein
MDNAKKIYNEYVCQLCQSPITDVGMCDFECANDLILVRMRPKGSVTHRIYEMLLISEEPV